MGLLHVAHVNPGGHGIMKVGDLIVHRQVGTVPYARGIIVDFLPLVHYKQVQKVRVLSEGKIQDWILQYCAPVAK